MVGIVKNKMGFDQLTFFDVKENTLTNNVEVKEDLPRAIILGESGSGKTVLIETVSELYYRLGYKIVKLTDKKDSLEGAWCCFEPREQYHLNELKYKQDDISYRRLPSKYPINIFTPFSYNIKDSKISLRKKMPPIKFFTFSIKNLSRENLSVMLNLDKNSELIDTALIVLQNLDKNDGLPQFFNKFTEMTQNIDGDSKYRGRKIQLRSSLGEEGRLAGDLKDVKNLKTFLKPFHQTDRIIASDSCQYNIDLIKQLNDQKNIDIYTYAGLSDEKSKVIALDILMQHIMDALASGKVNVPVLLLVDEITAIMPKENSGYLFRIAQNTGIRLITMRSIGKKGCGFLLAGQSMNATSENITAMGMSVLLGANLSIKDNGTLLKNYRRDAIRDVMSLKNGQWHFFGYFDTTKFKVAMPCHAHKELNEDKDFFTKYAEVYPDNLVILKDDYDKIADFFKAEDLRDEQYIKEYNTKLKEHIDKEEQEKEKKKLEKEQEQNKEKEEIKKVIKTTPIEVENLILKMFNSEILDKTGKEIGVDRIGDVLKSEYGIGSWYFTKIKKFLINKGVYNRKVLKKEIIMDGDNIIEKVISTDSLSSIDENLP